MTHPDDATVVRVISERDGFENIADYLEYGLPIPFTKSHIGGTQDGLGEADDTLGREIKPLPDYLHSIDALRPVLAKLTPEERDRFLHLICGNAEGARWLSFEQLWHCLTLDPSVLARCIAEAVLACKSKE